MKSEFNAFTWAYILNQDKVKYGRDPYAQLRMYAEYHKWDDGFVKNIENELDKLVK